MSDAGRKSRFLAYKIPRPAASATAIFDTPERNRITIDLEILNQIGRDTL
jgi:hypothetical protein